MLLRVTGSEWLKITEWEGGSFNGQTNKTYYMKSKFSITKSCGKIKVPSARYIFVWQEYTTLFSINRKVLHNHITDLCFCIWNKKYDAETERPGNINQPCNEEIYAGLLCYRDAKQIT